MNTLSAWFNRFLAGHHARLARLTLKKSDEKRITAIKNHIGDKQRLLQQCRDIDRCHCEDEIIDLLAKASILMKIDPSFKEEFERLQQASNISSTSKMILKRIEN